MTMDIEQIRKDINNYDKKIFFDSAGSSLMPKSVVQQITTYLQREEYHGGYFVSENQKEEIENFYPQAAQLINSKPHNIAYTHDATDSYIKALSSINFKSNDVIITTDNDYGSNHIQFLSLKNRFGIKIKRIKTLENGELDISDFEKLVDIHNPKLVAITHVPTNSGLIQNVKAIGKICNERQVLFLLDACQSIGQINVDVQEIKCDFLTTTGRKFLRGPRGTGFLYVSDNVLEKEYYPLFIDGFGAKWTKPGEFKVIESAKRFETWEKPYALKVGLTEALKYLNQIGIDNVESYNSKLMKQFRSNISSISGINLYDKGLKKCNILTFNKTDKSLENIKAILKENNIYFSVSDKKWGVIDFEKKGIEWLLRLSPHYFNTLAEIDHVSEIIEGI